MPNLPRLRRPRDGAVSVPPAAEPSAPRIEEIQTDGVRWINIEQPGGPERAWLEEHFDFHALDFEDVLSHNQRPKIDEYPDYLFLVLHIPVFNQHAGRLGAGELDLFVGPDYVVTLPNQPLPPVEAPTACDGRLVPRWRWCSCSAQSGSPGRCCTKANRTS